MKKTAWLSLLLVAPFMAFANLQNYMYTDLEVIKNTFRSQYALTEWKETYAGWDLDKEMEIAKGKIAANPNITVKDYHKILKDFFNSTHDFHVDISFYSTEAAILPLQFKSAEGKYFITSLEKNSLPSGAANLKVGDEIVSINGKPVADVVNEFKRIEFNQGSVLTDQAQAEYFFPIRLGSSGHLVPKGAITFEIKAKGSNSTKKYTFNWIYFPEEIKSFTPAKSAKPIPNHIAKKSKNILNRFTQRTMMTPYYTKDLKVPMYEGRESLGARQSFVPTLGKVIWNTTTNARFHAYLFEAPNGKKIGYIRIANYRALSDKDANSLLTQFKDLIKKFQTESDALVIDQVNNPGGSMWYMYSLISVLSDKPLTVPKHRVSLTPKEVADALLITEDLEIIATDQDAKEMLGPSIHGYPMSKKLAQQLLSYHRFQISEWNSGRTLTTPVALFGVDAIPPCPEVHYTKPILVLINALDFSCGDFLPAILQDNHRATLFGTRTSGAGGYVSSCEYPNLLGIESYSHTASMAERIDASPIENLGVTPDIEYNFKKSDLTDNYSSYAAAVLSAVLGLTQ